MHVALNSRQQTSDFAAQRCATHQIAATIRYFPSKKGFPLEALLH